MFKFFVRTFAFRIIKKPNLQVFNQKKPRDREQFDPLCRTKNKTTTTSKKMLRTWEFTQEARDVQQQCATEQRSLRQYRLISYNILAQDLLVEHCYLYRGINSQHLRWEHRLTCLRNELIYLDPDILCVQEMQYNHVKEFVGRLNEKRKLEYIFKKKTGHRTDGCAIIYDKEKFKLVAEREIEFYKPSIVNLNRENIALLAKFQLCDEPDKYIVIGTTHLLFNPRRHDVRVAQVDFLLENLEIFARKSCTTNNDDNDYSNEKEYFPVILTGDFNSESGSPPYIRLTSPYEIGESIDDAKSEAVAVTNSPETENDKMQVIDLTSEPSTPFKLSAIDFGSYCASTYHDRWITVDYVLRSVKEEKGAAKETSDVKVLSIYKLPTVRNCERIGKIPNQYLGSDHYLQAIEFIVA